MMVQRYVASYNDYYTHEEGAFVAYEDYAELESAVNALLIDISRRYPGEEFKCPLIAKLAEITKYDTRN